MSDLSEGWVTTNGDNLFTQIVGGGTPSKSNVSFFQGNIPFMTVKDMKERFISDTIVHISAEAVEYSSTIIVPADTLIVATRMSLGKIVRPLVETAINQDLKALFIAEGIDKTFVEYWWRCHTNLIQNLGTGTTVKGIRLEDIRSLSIDLPPLKEQKRIADKLDLLLARVDACRDRLDRVSMILKRFRQSVLSAATSGEITEDWRAEYKSSEHEIETEFDFVDAACFGDFRFPSSWSVNRLGEIAEIVGGITKDTKKQDPSDEELPYLRVANV